MKKLLIAAALTASVCSFGANINATGFEADNSLADGYFNKGTSDNSEVKSYEEGAAPAATKATAAGADSIGSKYLSLSTEGDTLWRTINEYTAVEGTDTTVAKSVAATGTYIDTLVQFTATEEAPTVASVAGSKLAMWLEGAQDEDKKLCVYGYQVTSFGDAFVGEVVPFTLNVTIEPSKWYRLTVKAVEITSSAEDDPWGVGKMGFAIYIDGNLVKPVETAFAADAIAAFKTAKYVFSSDEVEAALGNNELIPTMTMDDFNTETLYGVGFKGTGAIDSIAWTDDDIMPFPEINNGFTLTITMNDGIDAVKYAIGDADPVDYTEPVAVNKDDVVTITATAKDWWLAPADQTVTVDGDELVEVNATEVTAGNAGVTVPEGTSTDALNAALAWAKSANKTFDQVKAAPYFYSDYLLGFTDFSTEEPVIEIIDITPGDGEKPTVVKAKVTVGGVTKIEDLSTATMNGTLMYKAASTLEGLEDAEPKAAIGKDDQFFKVVVE